MKFGHSLCAIPLGVASVRAAPVARSADVSALPITTPSLTYLLPAGFQENVSQSFLQVSSGHGHDTFSTEQQASPFVAYDPEFRDLLPPNASMELLVETTQPWADEMGVWVWDREEVWMASASNAQGVSVVSVLDLKTKTVRRPNTTMDILNPNGGGYFQGKVYIAGEGNATVPPCIYEVDPETGNTSVLLNSYFGLRFNGPNDLTWANIDGKSYLFFSDDPLASLYNGGDQPTLPDAVWRFDPAQRSLQPVVDRTDVLVPNGVRVDANSSKLYVTDTPPLEYGVANLTASSAIYSFDLDASGSPYNKRLFGLAERGIADGLHLDDAGRVWTGEGDGIVVRNPLGKVIGMFNALAILGKDAQNPLQNFALAGDTLIILAYTKIYAVKLSHTIVAAMT